MSSVLNGAEVTAGACDLDRFGGFVQVSIRRNPNHQSISPARQQHPVSVSKKLGWVLNDISASTWAKEPLVTAPDEVVAPTNNRQVNLEPLALELRDGVRQRTTRLCVIGWRVEPLRDVGSTCCEPAVVDTVSFKVSRV